MASFHTAEGDGVSKICFGYCNDESEQLGTCDSDQSKNLGDDILDDLDSYLEDINDRLTISRMVSDSIIKGMVNAVSQEATEVVVAKELEVAKLKEALCSQQYGKGDLRNEVEAMVFVTVVQGLQGEYEKQLWDVDYVLALIDRLNEIPSLRHELSSIQKCLVGTEVGNLSPQGSIEMDHFHWKVLSNHGLPSAQVSDGNGRYEESKVSMPENLETSPLKHMSTQELYQHFRTVITEIKRGHESTIQQMTEECFTLKRELLKERELVKERGPFAAMKKDKDFELLKKKIPEVIAKLDDIVRENDKLSEFCNYSRDKLSGMLSENYHLKGLLNKQKEEVHHLSVQASDATKKLLQHAWAEEKLHKLVGDLERDLQDEHIDASVSEEVFKCVIRELAALIKSSGEDLYLKSIIMQDISRIIHEQVYYTVDVSSKSDHDEIDLQASIIQQIYEIVFQELLGNLSMDLRELKDKCLKEDESSDFLQRKVLEIENELTMKVEENEELKHQVFMLEKSIQESDKLLHEFTDSLGKQEKQFAEEHNNLMHLRANQEAVIFARNEELVLLQDKLKDYQKQIDIYTNKVDKLNKELELSEDKWRKSDEDKTKLISALELKHECLASLKAKDSEHIEHMESLCHVIQGLSKSFTDFELRIKESIGWHNVRLENSAFQLYSLIPKLNVLRRTGSLYKERLEKKCSDLQKAEAEVDLLGDEVDVLLSLLEKIYVALDHYSPILQHYPGIIEILKLVKRELSGEANKAV